MSISESFEQSFQYFLDNKDQLMTRYKDEVIAIYRDKVLGVYESEMDAYLKVPSEHNIKTGSFVIKKCSEDVKPYVRVYHSKTDMD